MRQAPDSPRVRPPDASPTGPPGAAGATPARWQPVADALTDAIVSLDRDGRVREWDARMTRLTGHCPDEVVGRSFRDLVAAPFATRFEDLVYAAAARADLPAQRLRLRHRDGRALDVELTVVPVTGPEDQRADGYVVALRDVGERGRFETELRELLHHERAAARRQTALATLRAEIMTGRGPAELMGRVAHHACSLLDAATAVVARVDPVDERARLEAVASSRPLEIEPGAGIVYHGSLVEQVSTQGAALSVERPAAGGTTDLPAGPGGPAAGAPVRHDGHLWGTLTVARSRGARAFAPSELDTLEDLAALAGLALDLAAARSQRERLLLFEERDRVAADLHDRVIQDLFALGLTVDSLRRRMDPQFPRPLPRHEVDERLASVSERIDTVIKDLRSTVFALHHNFADTAVDVQTRMHQLVTEAVSGSDIELESRIGPIPASRVSADVVENLLSVAREAVSNAVRHSHAARITVTGGCDEGKVHLTVADDGVGIGWITRRSGVENMRRRAERLGGTFELTSVPGNGTSVSWSVPVPPGRD